MFYDTFRRLCEEKGVSCNKAALEIGLSNSTPTKWKKTGAIPDSTTLARVSRYFGVTNDYLLGFTIEAQIDNADYQIRELKTRLNMATGAEREDIENALAVLEESYDDLCFAKSLASPPEKEKEPTPVSESGPSDKELISLWSSLTPEEILRVKDFALGLKAARKEPPSRPE